MNKKVQGITEAFSMQPACYYVGANYQRCKIERIELEFEPTWPNGMERDEYVYHGYDIDGNILFEFLANTVNVTYIIEL